MIAYNVSLGGLLVLMAGWLFTMIRSNTKKIDCVEEDVSEIKVSQARTEEKIDALGRAVVKSEAAILSRLNKLNNKG